MKLKTTGKSIHRYYTHEIENDWQNNLIPNLNTRLVRGIVLRMFISS